MPQFTRGTIIAAVELLGRWYHKDIDRFFLEHHLEGSEANGDGSIGDRTNCLIRYLLDHPDATTEDGANLVDTIVRSLVEWAISSAQQVSRWEPFDFGQKFPKLARALKRDSFVVEDGQLRRTLPEALDLPKADDEVHELLKTLGFNTSTGHLDQAIENHAKGNWAAANGQLRSFIESLLDETAAKLSTNPETLPPPGPGRRTWLANSTPPFFLAYLNEWDGQGKGFLEGFFRRLHPQGSHPGLSDEDDCTFRLHLSLLVARLLLRRLTSRIGV